MTAKGKPRTFDHHTAHRMRAAGVTYQQIADELGVSYDAIRSACARIDGRKHATGRRRVAPAAPARVSIFTPWAGKVNAAANVPAPEQRQSVWSRWMAGDE